MKVIPEFRQKRLFFLKRYIKNHFTVHQSLISFLGATENHVRIRILDQNFFGFINRFFHGFD